jgi:MscS family membrane protein
MTVRPQALRFRPLFVALALVGAQVNAQDAAAPEEPEIIADPHDRGTPLRSIEGFLTAADVGDYETASEYLDLRNIRGKAAELTGPQLARRLDVIVKRATWVDIDELVDDPAGRSNDGLPDYRDSLGVVLDGPKEVRLLMQKVPRGDGEFIWKVSNATVSLVPTLYDTYGYSEIIEELRRSLPAATFLGVELFKWVAALAAAVVAYGVIWLIAVAVRGVLGDPNKPSHRKFHRFLTVPVAVGAVLLAMNAVAMSLGLGITADKINRLSPVSPLITVWVLFASIDLFREIYSDRLLEKGRAGVQVLLRPISNATKLLIFIAAMLYYLDGLGINITTVLAGLGVGGVAVALALQKPMEDMFGAVTLYTQQPVRVGDFCKIGDTVGTIEEIGLRTTTFRTLANTLIAVPNARLATEAIDNISRRQKILYKSYLRLRYESTSEQIRRLLDDVRELLGDNERVNEGYRARFVKIDDDSLKIEIFAYFDTTDWAEYLELAEELNLDLLEIVTNAGMKLAPPAVALQFEAAAIAASAAQKASPTDT